MRKVLDWKFFLRVAVAVTALTLFLSAALAADGADIVSGYDATRSHEVRLKEAQLAFLKSFIKDHSADLDLFIKGEKKIETTINIGSTEYQFSGFLTDLITVSAGTSLEDFMKLIDKQIDALRAENKDHLSVHESTAVVPEPKATATEGSSEKDELIISLVRCIKQMQAEFNESIKASALAMALIKAELDKTKKEQENQFEQFKQYLGLKEHMTQVNEFKSEFKNIVDKYVELKRAQSMGDRQRADQLNAEIQNLVADLYPKLGFQERGFAQQDYSLQIQLAQLNQEFNNKETTKERKEVIQKEFQSVYQQLTMLGKNREINGVMISKLREVFQETQNLQSTREQNLIPVTAEQAEAIKALVGGGQFQGQGVAYRTQRQPQEKTFAGFLKSRQSPMSGTNMQTREPVRTPMINDGFVQTPMVVDPMPSAWRNPLVEQEQQRIQYFMQQQARQSQMVEQDISSGRLNFL